MLDPTQTLLAIIAIITTLLTGIGAGLFFLGRYFIRQIDKLQDLWREDQKTFVATMQSLAKPLNELVEMNKVQAATSQKNMTDLAALVEKVRKNTTRARTPAAQPAPVQKPRSRSPK